MRRIFRQFSMALVYLVFALTSSCKSLPFAALATPMDAPNSYKAVYLTIGAGELSENDLQAHLEIACVSDFEEFMAYAGTRIALWIDKNAVSIVDKDWLNSPPQKYYPLALIGYNQAIYCFRDILGVGGIEGPYVDWSKEILEPGFCVWMIRTETNEGRSADLKSYRQLPSVQDILDITNPMLEAAQDIKVEQ